MSDKNDNEKELNELLKNAGLQNTTTKALLAGLTAREAKVLRMRLGVDLKTNSTLEEVGKQFNVTRQRIREIENKALARLRCDDDPGAA